MPLQYVAKVISNFKPAKFMHVRAGGHNDAQAKVLETLNIRKPTQDAQLTLL